MRVSQYIHYVLYCCQTDRMMICPLKAYTYNVCAYENIRCILLHTGKYLHRKLDEGDVSSDLLYP